MPLDPTIPHTDITYRIIGCAMRVHNRMGPGLKEVHYQRALTAEMRKEGLLVYEEYPVEIWDGDVYIGWLSLDHFVENCIVVEDEAFVHMLTDAEVAKIVAFLSSLTGEQPQVTYPILPPSTATTPQPQP